MSSDDYRAALTALGLSQAGAARFLGIAPRTGRAYALGESPIPGAVSILLRLMLRRGFKVDDVERILK